MFYNIFCGNDWQYKWQFVNIYPEFDVDIEFIVKYYYGDWFDKDKQRIINIKKIIFIFVCNRPYDNSVYSSNADCDDLIEK